MESSGGSALVVLEKAPLLPGCHGLPQALHALLSPAHTSHSTRHCSLLAKAVTFLTMSHCAMWCEAMHIMLLTHVSLSKCVQHPKHYAPNSWSTVLHIYQYESLL